MAPVTPIKVAQLTSVHPVHDTRIFVKQCPALAEAGYDVTLIACSGRSVTSDKFKIVLLPRPSSRVTRIVLSSARVLKSALASRARVHHFHDPELLIIGLLLRALGKSVIYDVHEDYSETIRIKSWIPKSLRSLTASCFNGFEHLASRLMSANVAATPAIAKRLPARNTIIVQNFPIIAEFQGISNADYEKRPPRLAYIGTLTRERGILELVRSLPLIANIEPSIRMTLAGTFSESAFEAEVRGEHGWTFVDYEPWLSRRDVIDRLSKVRAGVVAFHPVGNYIEAYPVKMFEYMAAALPVIASDFPLNRQLVRDRDCGLLVNPKSAEDVAAAAIKLLADPSRSKAQGESGRRAAIEEFSWDGERRKLLALYSRLATQK